MQWVQVITDTAGDQTEVLEEALHRLGALSVTQEDAADQPLFEPDPGDTPLWNAVRTTGLFPAEIDTNQLLGSLKTELPEIREFKIEILEDKDWIREWMDQFQPMRFGKRLWICPSWHTSPAPEATNIMLDPGLAFGTGTHPTTALCLEWLDTAIIENKSLIDFGCGSGVLGVAAALLGSREVISLDIDPQALLATTANAKKNNVAEKLKVDYPNKFIEKPADILIANILSGPLVQLAPKLTRLIKPGGVIVLSGILQEQVDQIIKTYQSAFTLCEPTVRDGWVRIEGLRCR